MASCEPRDLGPSQATAWSALQVLWFIEAAGKNDVQEMREMLAEGLVEPTARDLSGRSAVHAAAAEGSEAALALLLQRGALDASAAGGSGRGRQRPPLLLAAARGNVGCVDILLRAQADPGASDTVGKAPLHEASWLGHAGCARRLLVAGATLGARDAWGRTPLHWAAVPPEWVVSEDRRAVMELLLASQAPLEAITKGRCTALHLACAHGEVEAAQQLLEASADGCAFDEQGQSPLHKAAARGGEQAVPLLKLLLSRGHGCDPQARDHRGREALQLALESGSQEAAAVLSTARPPGRAC